MVSWGGVLNCVTCSRRFCPSLHIVSVSHFSISTLIVLPHIVADAFGVHARTSRAQSLLRTDERLIPCCRGIMNCLRFGFSAILDTC